MESSRHPTIHIKIHSPGGHLPEYQSELASGCDLRCALDEPVSLASMERLLVPTGIRIEIPPGFEAQVRPRSGLAIKKGISMPNTPGTIDADYRGELKVPLINLSRSAVVIEPGERIAQLIFMPVVQAHFISVGEASLLSATERDEGGFGSTGK